MLHIVVGGKDDGPGYEIYVGSDGKLHFRRIPGWDPLGNTELASALNIIDEAVKLKIPEVSEAIIQGAMQVVEKELDTHVKDKKGSVVLLR